MAVKVLPKDFVADADRLRRFEQEAETPAVLNHHNVLTVFDAGVHEGAPYLVSQLLEGKTLREAMNGGALPVRKAVEYAPQIVNGLAAAHSKDLFPQRDSGLQTGPISCSSIDVLVSRDGGDVPVGNPNGKELFFLDPERTLPSVEIKTDNSGAIKPGAPKPLFRRPANATSQIDGYDVSRDGQRFLFALDVSASGSENITVLLNWVGESNR